MNIYCTNNNRKVQINEHNKFLFYGSDKVKNNRLKKKKIIAKRFY
jgi:hypothetical protein